MTYGCQSCSVVGVQHDKLVLLFVYRVTSGAMMTYECQAWSVVCVQGDTRSYDDVRMSSLVCCLCAG